MSSLALVAAICSADDARDADALLGGRTISEREISPDVTTMASSHPDLLIVRAIRDGNVETFSRVFHERYARLARFATRMIGSADSADDVVADVFIALWRGRAAWNPNVSINAYLFRAVRNRALNAVRDRRVYDAYRQAAAQESDAPAMANTPVAQDALVEAAEREAGLWATIARLPERSRTLLELRWQARLSSAEVAAVLGISVGAVDTGVSRAVVMLRTLLPEDFR